jgi:hypothetical protein
MSMKLTNWHCASSRRKRHQLDQVSRHRNQRQLAIGEFDPVDQIAFDFDEIVAERSLRAWLIVPLS